MTSSDPRPRQLVRQYVRELSRRRVRHYFEYSDGVLETVTVIRPDEARRLMINFAGELHGFFK